MEQPFNCQSLMQQCKQEAKHLLEVNVTNGKVHWSHPAFISFCTSIDRILSFEVHRRLRSVHTSQKQWLTSSGRVLQELGKVYPVASSMYNLCYSKASNNEDLSNGRSRSPNKPDYSRLQSNRSVEYRVLWIRTSIMEKTLKPIVDEILKKPELYYTEKSIPTHSVYGELFGFLLDGPCSLRFSRMKTVDASLISPAPSEIINRYTRVLPDCSLGYTTYHQDSISSEVWGHIQSLYHTSVTTCLFGKNNILIKPPESNYPLEGYLTLVQLEHALFLKWLPNALINRDCGDTSSDRFHILSLDITNDVAHVHCHQGPGLNESRINLIGYNGIAYPALLFPQSLSLIHFLEALENGLHPKGCLEPPLWFLRQSQLIPNRQNSPPTTSTKNGVEGFPVTWNQVFRVRFSRQDLRGEKTTEIAEWDEGYERSGVLDTTHSVGTDDILTRVRKSKSPQAPFTVQLMPMNRKQSYSTGFEKLQGKVSHQLLARYFYSWMSYCRHISRVKKSLSHLIVKPPPAFDIIHGHDSDCEALSESDWTRFLDSDKNEKMWAEIVRKIYGNGMPADLRKKVWPYLLKVIPFNATAVEVEAIIENGAKDYKNVLNAWKTLERNSYTNNDPTSTCIKIRLGASPHWPQQLDVKSDTHPIIEDGPNLIDLGSTEKELIQEGEDLVELKQLAVGDSDDGSELGYEDQSLRINEETSLSSSFSSIDGDSHFTPLTSAPLNGVISALSSHEEKFLEELFKIDKDIPRCDRDYWYFQKPENLTKLRNIISSYIWKNTDTGYSQGMCDLLAPLLVVFDDEKTAFMCFQELMLTMDFYFPPKTGVQERMNNLRSLLQILESDFFQYLSELPMGDSLFYSYRWFLVNFKREFRYQDVFLLWETCWASRWFTTLHFEVFVAMAIIQQYKSAIMDAQLDASEILNLFTDLSEKKALNCLKTIAYAKSVVSHICQESSIEN